VDDYDPAGYWSEVGESIRSRRDGRLIAGDDSPYLRYQRELFLSRFLSKVPAEESAVLEVGPGPGGNLAALAERHPRRLVGCDISPVMVELAREHLAGLPVEVVATDGDRLPFDAGEFDIAFTVTVLHHNPDHQREALIGELCRVASSEVYLFEHTATRREDKYSNFVRPVGDYARACLANGFELVAVEHLDTFVSHALEIALARTLSRNGGHEGARFSPAQLAAEARLLPLTRRLDRVIRRRSKELTMMQFRRSASSPA
jgi:SAM-dependent methyltransferase